MDFAFFHPVVLKIVTTSIPFLQAAYVEATTDK